MSDERKPNAADVYAGQRVRIARFERDMTQMQLADKLGITFQQVQKYETGATRLSVGRLAYIAEYLGKRVDWFFPVTELNVMGDVHMWSHDGELLL